ncbi:iron-containing alcohol dehydrogenase [Candidatus Vecturithrix granuli]|uniref:Iron-containing alcohol dehydrogenase n=1 Tax=Vecturithrix granuli TaxID=1499967 RepID=A0A081C6T2_VECG1|nr:iron-containing alcohol dehydrogenase [Candidatus Vecturithrix granuli]
MQNFTFWNPTKIIFGTDTIPQIGQETRRFGNKALLVYGKSSIKKSGIYDMVLASFQEAGIEVIEHAGVKSNPVLSHVNAGIALVKQKQIGVIVAVGGGSVIDESKAIAVGAQTDHDVWDYYLGVREVEAALPVLAVLTIAATGSEMNLVSVVTNEETQQKFNLRSPFIFPKVSILDPTVTFSVPRTYSAYGAVDAISHTIEGYFNGSDPWTPIQDRYVEGLILSIMESAERILENAEDYQGRATMMWAATLALNGLPVAGIGAMRSPNHLIAHSLGAMYDIAHGAALSIVIPGWMTYASRKAPRKFAQFAQRIFNIQEESPEKQAEKGIAALKAWFYKIGAPVSLAEGNIPEEDIERIAENTQSLARKWNVTDEYTQKTVAHILTLCR